MSLTVLRPKLSVSMSTWRTQSDFTHKTTYSLCLAKTMENRAGDGGGKCKKTWGRGGTREKQDVGVGGVRRSQNWKQMGYQLPPKSSNVFRSVKLVWRPVLEDGCSIAEWPCSWTFFVRVLAKFRDVQSAQGRGAEGTGWMYWETSSCRHCGAVLCTHWYLRQMILYSVRFEAGFLLVVWLLVYRTGLGVFWMYDSSWGDPVPLTTI